MKTTFPRILALILVSAFAGCSPSSSDSNSPGAPTSAKIIIRGSNTVGEELAPALIAEYKKDHPKAQFDLESKGTSYGFGALMGGFCDIAGASRMPSKDELEAAQYHDVTFNDHIIGSYSVAVVVNAKNTLVSLSKDQVRDIFTGVITNWSALGGADVPIHLYARDPISGTYLGFRELALENKPYAREEKLFTNYEGIVGAVADDAGGIGYSSLELDSHAGVKAVAIDGVMPSANAVNKGTYPYARMLHLFTSNGHERQEAMDFLQFVLSDKGQKVVAQVGDTPLAKVNQ